MSLNLQSLIDKLNPVCRRGLEEAAQFCLAQTHYNVEVEHFLLKLIAMPETDVQHILGYYGVRPAEVTRELTRAVDRFKRGNNRTPALTPHVLRLLEQAWLLASIYLNVGAIRSGAVLLALLDNDVLRAVILDSAPSLKRIPRDSVKQDIGELIRTSPEIGETGSVSVTEAAVESPSSKTPALDLYTIDLTDRARKGDIDPIVGRDLEIRQLIDILCRRRQNNPILTGEAGVGKTAVVEGFALRLVAGDVPPSLKKISLRMLDLALLQAGAGIKGEFENRLKSVINEVKASARPIILFIDEAHTLIGAGGAAGQGDAANLLKPALARGELRTIAATTWSEYKKYIEKDPALARRFQVVKVDEPDEDKAVEMLRGTVANLKKHHGIEVLEEAVREAVRLSHRYITGRQLPDKAIGVLDTACARVAVGQNGLPPAVEDARSRIHGLGLELEALTRERNAGAGHDERIESIEAEQTEAEQHLEAMETRWRNEREAVQRVLKLQRSLASLADSERPSPTLDADRLKRELGREKAELFNLQGDTPMVPLCVDGRIVASVISDWTGIPVGKMLTDEIDTVLSLKTRMEQRIIGQDNALDVICRRIRTYRADLEDPGKPVGVFMLVGPSGVGKTETAATLADLLYGGERNMVVVNMSEYQEAYSVSGLKGAPPGYVGYGKGGVLTEAVRQKPYSLVLLDEVEKAHPDVMELFYQVFDKGTLEDSEGLVVDFKNTLILLTSNLGSEEIIEACHQAEGPPDVDTLVDHIRPALLSHFKPAFLGRLAVVPYFPLGDQDIRAIARLQLSRLQKRFAANHHIELTYGEDVVAAIAARCTEVDTGARNVEHILSQMLLPDLSGELLKRMAAGESCTGIYVYLSPDGRFSYRFEPSIGKVNGSLDRDYTVTVSDRQVVDLDSRSSVSDLIRRDFAEDRWRTHQTGNPRGNRRLSPKRSKSWLNLLKPKERS